LFLAKNYSSRTKPPFTQETPFSKVKAPSFIATPFGQIEQQPMGTQLTTSQLALLQQTINPPISHSQPWRFQTSMDGAAAVKATSDPRMSETFILRLELMISITEFS
jgi:hypothetical protein